MISEWLTYAMPVTLKWSSLARKVCGVECCWWLECLEGVFNKKEAGSQGSSAKQEGAEFSRVNRHSHAI